MRESRGFNRLGLLMTDEVIGESEYLNVFVQFLQVLNTSFSCTKAAISYVWSETIGSCDLQKQVVTLLLMKVSQWVMHYELFFTDVYFVFIKMCKIRKIKTT